MEEVRLVKIPVFMCGKTFIPDKEILQAKTLLTPKEAAAIFRVSRRTIYDWCSTGRLKSKTVGGNLRILSASVAEMLARDNDGDLLLDLY